MSALMDVARKQLRKRALHDSAAYDHLIWAERDGLEWGYVMTRLAIHLIDEKRILREELIRRAQRSVSPPMILLK
jgi:hypothetical protein